MASPAPCPSSAEVSAPNAQARGATQGLTRRVMLSALLGALVFAGLALYSDFPKLRVAASRFNLEAFGWGLLLAAINYWLRIYRWHYYLKRLGISLPRSESAVVFLSGFVMSVTPGKVGEVFKSLLLHESRRIAFARTAPIVVAERLTDLVALVLLTAFGSLTFPAGPVFAGAGALIVGTMVLLVSHRSLGEWGLALCARLPLIGRFAPRLRVAYETLFQLTRTAPMLAASGLALLAWAMECGSMYLILHGFSGVDLSFPAAAFAYAASTIIGALAMMPGGLGVTEVGMTGLLQALGGPDLTPEVAAATTIMVRVATLWFAVALGAVALAYHRARYAQPRR